MCGLECSRFGDCVHLMMDVLGIVIGICTAAQYVNMMKAQRL